MTYFRFLSGFVTLCTFAVITMGEVVVEKGSSRAVRPGPAGELAYAADDRGNRLPDFSYVGYHSGEKAIPDIPVRITLNPVEGDDTASIQAAIDKLERRAPGRNGFRGAVLLKRGVYHVEGKLTIEKSGIVLRGEVDGPDGTVIVAAGYGKKKYKRTLITVGNRNRIDVHEPSRSEITDDYVPVGARSFTVSSTKGYKVGHPIVVYRPSTAEWIHAIGCDRISPRWDRVSDLRWVKEGDKPGLYYKRRGSSGPRRYAKRSNESWEEFKERVPLSEDGKKMDFTRQWKPGSYDFKFERRIVAIDGNRGRIDAPLVHALDSESGGGAIFYYETPGRVREVGIENMRLVSEFAAPVQGHPYGNPNKARQAEKHAWHAVKLNRNTENTWVRNVTANYFGWSVVSASGVRATVQDCVSLGHASKIRGGRRYPFMIDGQLNLVQRCLAFEGRHEFVVQARTAGPNVFVDCLGKNSKSSAGPHHRYAIGTLFDNVKSEHYMESRYRGNSGTGHGWAGAQTVFYNCIAPGFKIEAPPGGISWVLGGAKTYNPDVRVAPASLYYRQVEERLGKEAVQRLVTDEQLQNLGKFPWAFGD
ncbi:MAG: hypothetical protein R6V56_08395 [Lentisphaeria bacterium]